MANYKIDGSLSGVFSGAGFNKTENAASSFTLDADAFLFSTGPLVNATTFNGKGAWTININGSLYGSHTGIYLMAVNSSAPPAYVGGAAGVINIGEDSSIHSDDNESGAAAIYTERDVKITNLGTIKSNLGSGIYIGGYGTSSVDNSGLIQGGNDFGIIFDHTTKGTVINSGSIHGAINFGSGDSKLTNTETGSIYVSSFSHGITFGAGNDTVDNKGTIIADVRLGDGVNLLTNSGNIDADAHNVSITSGIGQDTINNTGTLYGSVIAGDGTNKFTNSGYVGADYSSGVSYTGGSGADTVTNNSGGNLIGAVKLQDGTNILTNSGTIGSDGDKSIYGGLNTDTVTNTASGVLAGGVWLKDGTNGFTNNGNVGIAQNGMSYSGGNDQDTVLNTGSMAGLVDGGNGLNKLTNSGRVGHSPFGSAYTGGTGNDTVINSKGGVLDGSVLLGEATNIVTNDGAIGDDGGNSIVGGAATDTVTNNVTGVLTSDVWLQGGTNTFTNNGKVGFTSNHASYFGGNDQDTITNTGTLSGHVNAQDGFNKFTNSGFVGDDLGNHNGASYIGGSGIDTVTNNKGGVLDGSVKLGDGANGLTNFATIAHSGFSQNAVIGGSGVDNLNNSGTINGNVSVFAGNDIFKNTGQVTGTIDLGADNDQFTGGNFVDKVIDGLGADSYDLGGGNDTFFAFGGEGDLSNTKVAGGAGTDTFDASHLSTDGLIINLDSVAHNSKTIYQVGFHTGGDVVTATKSFAQDAQLVHGDTISGFEVVQGSAGNDLMFGSSAADTFYGNGGKDEMWGFGGNDILSSNGASGGEAYMVGGQGADKLTGTSAVLDYFVFTAANESGVTKGTHDQIYHFTLGEDYIRFTGVGLANTFHSQNPDGSINNNEVFHNIAGELRSFDTATGQMIQGDTDGDGKADFSVYVDGTQSHVWSLDSLFGDTFLS